MSVNGQFYDKGSVDGLIETLNTLCESLGVKITTIESNYVNKNQIGANSGVASLGSDGKVPSSQLPGYVDDVLEYNNQSGFPQTGESGKIYVAKDTNKTYRWSGSSYIEIGQSIALGETSSTAYAGNKGKANADAIAALQNLVNQINTNLGGKAPTKHDSAGTSYGVGTASNYGHVKLFKLANYSDSNKSNDDAAITAAFANALNEALHDTITAEVTQTLVNYATTSALQSLQNKVTQLQNSAISMTDNGDGTFTFTQNS